ALHDHHASILALGELVLEGVLGSALSPASHPGDVALLDEALFELSGNRWVGARSFREEHDSARLLVEALMHTKIDDIASSTLGEKEPESRHEVIGTIGQRRLTGDAHGLVDDDEVLVLVKNVLGAEIRPRATSVHERSAP